MSHPKITPKTITTPDEKGKETVKIEGEPTGNYGDSNFSLHGKNVFPKYQMTLPPDNDPTLETLADQAQDTMDVQKMYEDDPMILTQPLDFIAQLRVQFAQNSKAKLKDLTSNLPTIPAYRTLSKHVNSFKSTSERMCVLREIVLNYRQKIGTLQVQKKALLKDISKGGTTSQENYITNKYLEILKRTLNFAIQQHDHALKQYKKLDA